MFPCWTRKASHCPRAECALTTCRGRGLRTLAVFFAGLWCMHANALPDRALMLAATASVVRVQAFDANSRTFIGTGVVIAPQRVATSCHVTRQALQVVAIHRGETYRVAGQAHDIEHDVCVLDVPLLPAPALPFRRSADVRIGQPAWAMGFEGGAGIQFRVGIVRGLHRHDAARVIETTTAFTSGASGGALMSEDGTLLGLLTYRLRGDRRSYFAVPLDWLPAGFDAQSLPEIAPITVGTIFWQRPEVSLPRFLRAHRQQVEGDWPALLALTDAWIASDDRDAHVWWLRGTALEQGDGAAAAMAYRRALTLEPRFLPALMRLGRLSARLGQSEENAHLLEELHTIGGVLGACLDAPADPASTDASAKDVRHEYCDDF